MKLKETSFMKTSKNHESHEDTPVGDSKSFTVNVQPGISPNVLLGALLNKHSDNMTMKNSDSSIFYNLKHFTSTISSIFNSEPSFDKVTSTLPTSLDIQAYDTFNTLNPLEFPTLSQNDYKEVNDESLEKEDNFHFMGEITESVDTLTTDSYSSIPEFELITELETSTVIFSDNPTTVVNKKLQEKVSTSSIVGSRRNETSTVKNFPNRVIDTKDSSKSIKEVTKNRSTKSGNFSFSITNIDQELHNNNFSENVAFNENEKNILIKNDKLPHLNDFSSSIVLYVGISFAFALIMFVITSLWLLKRRKYQSKVYLSYELAKPQSHISKPMVPSILPGEVTFDMAKGESVTPREPLYLTDDVSPMQTIINSKYSGSIESCDSGIDNLAFTDASSSDDRPLTTTSHVLSTNGVAKEKSKPHRPVPNYARKKRFAKELSAKVCSSDGSIFPASPSLSNCLIPPPPYSSMNRNNKKLSLLDHSETPSKISIIKENETLPKDSSIVHRLVTKYKVDFFLLTKFFSLEKVENKFNTANATLVPD